MKLPCGTDRKQPTKHASQANNTGPQGYRRSLRVNKDRATPQPHRHTPPSRGYAGLTILLSTSWSSRASASFTDTTSRPPPSRGTRTMITRPSFTASIGPSPVRGFMAAIAYPFPGYSPLSDIQHGGRNHGGMARHGPSHQPLLVRAGEANPDKLCMTAFMHLCISAMCVKLHACKKVVLACGTGNDSKRAHGWNGPRSRLCYVTDSHTRPSTQLATPPTSPREHSSTTSRAKKTPFLGAPRNHPTPNSPTPAD